MTLNPYLHFDGNAEEAFTFYESVFGEKIMHISRFKDGPPNPKLSPKDAERILHIALPMGKNILMASDCPDSMADQMKTGTNISLSVNLDSKVEVDRVFQALSSDGKVGMPLAEMFWGDYFGMVTDKFGIQWMLTYHHEFVISRTFKTSKEKLYMAWTEEKEIKSWFTPEGFTASYAKMDFRVGGSYHYALKGRDGSEIWGKSVYREIMPNTKLVYINAFSDKDGDLTRHPMAPTWPIEMLTTVTFEEVPGTDMTTLIVTWELINPSDEERKAFDAGHESMRTGWGGTLDQLGEYLKKS